MLISCHVSHPHDMSHTEEILRLSEFTSVSVSVPTAHFFFPCEFTAGHHCTQFENNGEMMLVAVFPRAVFAWQYFLLEL